MIKRSLIFAIKSIRQGGSANSNSSCPLLQAESYSIKGKHVIVSSILALFAGCCPAAIAGEISQGIIDSVNAFSFRTMPHIQKEVIEVLPSLANSYSPVPVIVKSWIGFVLASPYHALPGRISSGFVLSVASYFFYVKAAARLSSSLLQVISPNCFDISALTSTFPDKFIDYLSGKAENEESSEYTSGQILESRIGWNRMCLSHDGFSPLRLATESGYSPLRSCFIIGREPI